MKIKPLIGLAGVLLLAMTSEFNDQVTTLALADVRGGLGISSDPGAWFSSVFVVGEVVGMCIAPWWAVTVTLRRMSLFVTALALCSTVLIPLSSSLVWLYSLRVLQGLSVGLTIPLLMTTALRVLDPPIRLYGLSAYALTATFAPTLAATMGALWTDGVRDWLFIFMEPIPLCAAAAALLWWGMPEEKPKWERLAQFDLWAFATLVVGFGSLATLLEQGDRLDWFNSRLISTLALVSAVTIPMFLYRQWTAETPFLKLQLLGRRNVAYGVSALILFLIVALSASLVPIEYLQRVQGYRLIQAQFITLEVALSQLILLPLTAMLLDHRHVDARLVSAVGLALILTACIADAHLTPAWNRDQFYLWQGLQSVGMAFVIMPILMLVTNVVKKEEGPFASALFNTPRAVTEAVGVWFIQIVARWRGGLHRNRLADQLGQSRLTLIDPAQLGHGRVPVLHVPGQIGTLAGGTDFDQILQQAVSVLTTSDTFVIIAMIVVVMGLLLFIPERTYPPRIALAPN